VGHPPATELLVGAQIKTERTPGVIRKCVVTRTTRSKLHRQGLDAKKKQTSLRRVKCFYLTSPFIELADHSDSQLTPEIRARSS
jgi:hypothetical protein